jgi:MFS family permease
MSTTTSPSVDTGAGPAERKPLMTGGALLMMNLGFFGVQFSFGLTQSAVNPLFLLIGADPDQLPILNLAGPVTGLLIQPLIGAISDRTWSPRWGRRRPFITCGAILCALILFIFPFVGALWAGVLCFWLLDAGNNTSMEPYRAFISDRLPKSQLARGFLTQSMFTGAGAVLANVSLFLLQKVSALDQTANNGVPYWMYTVFWIGTICILVTVLTAMARTKELTPSDEELEEMRSTPKGLGNAIREISDAVKTMPVAMHKIGVVFAFQWYAMFIYWQFLAVSLGETIFGANPEQGGPAWDDAIAWSGLMNGAYNFVTMVSALFLVGIAQRIGAKRVHAAALGLAALADLARPHRQSVPRAYPDDRRRHLLGQRRRRAVPNGRQHGSRQTHRRLHGHPQHDDRRPHAGRDGHLRLDLQPPPGQQGQQRDRPGRGAAWHRRRGDAVGEPARRGGRVADHAPGQQAKHQRLRACRGRLGRHPVQPVHRRPGRGSRPSRPGQTDRRYRLPRH